MAAHAALSLSERIPPLRGVVAPWVTRCLARQDMLYRAVQAHGSPANVLCVAPFVENIEGFDRQLRESVHSYLTLYARKPNKSRVFVQEAIRLGIGVDIASEDELAETLGLGCPSERVCVTAAVITERLAAKVVQHGVLTVVENEDQVRLLQQKAAERVDPHPILIRIGGVGPQGRPTRSRLGFHPEAARAMVRTLASGRYPNVTLQGFHFHANGYDAASRVNGVERQLELVDLARSLGLAPGIVDIGGGFPVRYLESGDEWADFHHELRRALCGEREPLTWNNDGLGLVYGDGRLHGSLNVYPYFNEKPKWLMLKELLHSRVNSGERVADAINRRSLQLRIEPGRALLDQCGFSIASVVHRSHDSEGELCVGLSMNFTQLRSSSAEFLVDPLLLSQRKAGIPTECYLSGSYCMDRDLLMKRKVLFPQPPAPGDLVCFLNTAGYMMHFLESPGHSFELAANLVFDVKSERLSFESRGRL